MYSCTQTDQTLHLVSLQKFKKFYKLYSSNPLLSVSYQLSFELNVELSHLLVSIKNRTVKMYELFEICLWSFTVTVGVADAALKVFFLIFWKHDDILITIWFLIFANILNIFNDLLIDVSQNNELLELLILY